MSPAALTVPAPAKVNLFLHVTGRRGDGYHLIESLFALIDLADTIVLEVREDGAIVRAGEVPGVAPADDLALRAAQALRRAAGVNAGVTIEVRKTIPLGAGLGGGSSDAASVLLALNRLWGLAWTRADLCAVGATLGADVPFFVGGQHALVRGIGDVLTPVTLPTLHLALACPPVHVATAGIFGAPELTRNTASAKMEVFSEGYGNNDLAGVTASRFAPVAEALAALRGVAPKARMTGSGAGVFAAFATADEARDALAAVPASCARLLARTISNHPLRGFAR